MDATVGLEEFHISTKEDLLIVVLGTYQIVQARSYYGKHIKADSA